MIEIKNVKKVYKAKKTDDTVALRNISATIPSTGLVFIVGTSGSGKSTLLNCVGGLDKVDSGSIIIDGIDITQLKEKELDKFRNTYLGFVFQDYNIIDEYNVFENINLSLELQGKEDKKLISETLNKLGLSNLEKRHINELSGGQKQRVAIARALVKNPSLILADEPTGNLDSKTSKQIFEILKSISLDRTVLVVSHDMEMAKTYGDIIIEISDGKIINETKPKKSKEKEEKNKVELKQFSLSRKNILKLTLGNIQAKLGKFIFTAIIMGFAFFFLEFALNAHLFKSSTLVYDTMKKNDEFYFNVGKENCALDRNGSSVCEDMVLGESDIQELKSATNHKLNRVYSLVDGATLLDFEYAQKSDNKNDYFEQGVHKFVVIDDDENILHDLVGTPPKNSNEIIVNQRKAEEIVKYGVEDSNGNIYKPENLDALINEGRLLKFGSNNVIVIGYIKLNDKTLDIFKDKEKINDEDYKTYFNDYIVNRDEYYYVKEDFINNVKLQVDDTTILNGFNFITHEFGEDTYLSTYKRKVFTTPLNILTKTGEKLITELKEGEIVLPISSLELYDENYKLKLEEYYKKHVNLTYEESVREYTLEYLKSNRFLDKKFYAKRSDNLPSKEIKIVGLILEENTYISQDLINFYSNYNKIIVGTRTYENKKSKIKQVFDNLELDSEYYFQKKVGELNTVSYKFIANVSLIKSDYEFLKGYIAIITSVFILFAVLLFYNFIATTITYSKKKIGILRAIGTSHKDVSKIFSYESLIIALTGFVISLAIWYPSTSAVNKLFTFPSLVRINHFVIEDLTIIIALVSIIVGSILLTYVCLSRLSKIKPIDAILEK